MNRCLFRRSVNSVTTAKDSTFLLKCAVQGNNQPLLWKLGQRLMKLKKVRPIIPLSLDILITSRMAPLKIFKYVAERYR